MENNNLIHSHDKTNTLGARLKKLTQTLDISRDLDPREKGRERRASGADLARGKLQCRRGSTNQPAAAALGHRGGGLARARSGERRKERPRDTPRRGLYAPGVGSPDALYVAPDASGDHRTHAQRGMQIGIAPDDGHRMLALASGALGHAR